jgi:hypothetical protein
VFLFSVDDFHLFNLGNLLRVTVRHRFSYTAHPLGDIIALTAYHVPWEVEELVHALERSACGLRQEEKYPDKANECYSSKKLEGLEKNISIFLPHVGTKHLHLGVSGLEVW